jgi:hypothetical protein
MTIENPKQPTDSYDMYHLAADLIHEFDAQGLILESDPGFGGLNRDYFGFNVDDPENRVNLGFLQIIFDPNGWTVLVPQNELGKRSLMAVAKSLGRDSEKMVITEVNIHYSMYHTYFPNEKPIA